MSVEQYQKSVNTLDKEIATLEKKKVEADKKCADIQSKINSIQKNIASRTSANMVASKKKQIASLQAEYSKKMSSSADVGRKISDKRKKRNDAYLKLQKAQKEEQKKQEMSLKKMQKAYENKIEELNNQAVLQLRTNDNIEKTNNQQEMEEYDVFVSHAWEDKESFAEEFVESLRECGAKVWYDTTQIKWGDSMRSKIDDGLRKSKFGVVVLSPDYIKDGKYWTKTELDGLFQIESVNGKMLLPVWHNLTKKEVMEYSPIVASKLAMTTANMTPQEMAKELYKLLSEE